MQKGYRLGIKGIVQGVGFRPCIYNLACQLALTGWVLNDGNGVTVELEGNQDRLELFLVKLKKSPPPIAKIESITVTEFTPRGYDSFVIRQSPVHEGSATFVSPDIATCPDCLREMGNYQDVRYQYPFTNCTNCGPRFSIIAAIPYDRKNTTMKDFTMCPSCSAEYNDPANRRFHAQPNACSCCGPQVQLLDRNGNLVPGSTNGNPDYLKLAGELLKAGKLLAIKGLGGYHLACDATNSQAVAELRRRKIREDRPLAIMVPSIEVARTIVEINQQEALLLAGKERPIVLLEKKVNGIEAAEVIVAEQVAPSNGFLGIMLPYTPLHQLLLEKGPNLLVLTSGNLSSEPIVYNDNDLLPVLGRIADYFLVHNRAIFRRCDDSVVRVFEQKPYFIRRSRGFAPAPLSLPKEIGQVLACGAEQKNTFCLTRGQAGFISHHIGDLENMETLTAFEEGIRHFEKLFALQPLLVAYDLHPEYLSTKYAQELTLPKIGIQHHEAHIASCMAENGVIGPVLGVAFDGTGYGWDGQLWGGEFLTGDYQSFERIAYLKYIQLPGGTAAIKEPWRMAIAYLRQSYGSSWQNKAPGCLEVNQQRVTILEEMLEKGINTPWTSSMGRLFDGIAAMLGLRGKVNYEGQAAIELEQLAYAWAKSNAPLAEQAMRNYTFRLDGLEIDAAPLIKELVADLELGVSLGEIAWRFHHSVALLVLGLAKRTRQTKGINQVCLSGGVFQNLLLLTQVVRLLRQEKFLVYYQSKVPCNDGGIALGQALIAWERRDTACV